MDVPGATVTFEDAATSPRSIEGKADVILGERRSCGARADQVFEVGSLPAPIVGRPVRREVQE